MRRLAAIKFKMSKCFSWKWKMSQLKHLKSGTQSQLLRNWGCATPKHHTGSDWSELQGNDPTQTCNMEWSVYDSSSEKSSRVQLRENAQAFTEKQTAGEKKRVLMWNWCRDCRSATTLDPKHADLPHSHQLHLFVLMRVLLPHQRKDMLQSYR